MSTRESMVESYSGPEIIDGLRSVTVRRDRLVLAGETPISFERTVASKKQRGTVILVHGLAQNKHTWRLSQRSYVAHLAERGWEVLNVELRGHGDSREAGSGNANSIQEYVSDLNRLVDWCETPPFVIGHSLGGAVGIGTFCERPIRGLVHLAGVYGFAQHNPVIRGIARATVELEDVLAAMPVRMSTGWTGSLIARLYSVTDLAGYGAPIAGWTPGSIERDLLAERLAIGFDWTSLAIWQEMCAWACGEPSPWQEAFEERDRPLLVLVGDHDPLVRPQDAELTFNASGSSDKEMICFDLFHHEVHWGHIDLIIGRHAPQHVWPAIDAWLDAR